MKLIPSLCVVVLTITIASGCSRIVDPVDVHTQYVAAVLVTPQCLTQCDLNGDGLIQYRLWPGTETPSVEEPGASVYGITEDHGPLSEEVAEKDQKIDQQRAKDDLETNRYAEIDCWQQCRGPVMTSALPETGKHPVVKPSGDMVPVAEPPAAARDAIPY